MYTDTVVHECLLFGRFSPVVCYRTTHVGQITSSRGAREESRAVIVIFPRRNGIYSKIGPTFDTLGAHFPLLLSSSSSAASSTATTTPHGSRSRRIRRGGSQFLLFCGRIIHQESVQIERFGQNPRAHGGSPYTQRRARDGILAATVYCFGVLRLVEARKGKTLW
jgi:hypothetical protein